MTESINSFLGLGRKKVDKHNTDAEREQRAKDANKPISVFGEKMDNEDIANAYFEADSLKKDGKVSQNEWLAPAIESYLPEDAEEKSPTALSKFIGFMANIFNKADANGDGYLNIDEYKDALTQLDAAQDELKEIIGNETKQVDGNRNVPMNGYGANVPQEETPAMNVKPEDHPAASPEEKTAVNPPDVTKPSKGAQPEKSKVNGEPPSNKDIPSGAAAKVPRKDEEDNQKE